MDVDDEAQEKVGVAAESAVDSVGEDSFVGGAAAYGAPGAWITIHRDTLLEKMFEGNAGDVSGVTGLWPLKRCLADTHHTAVLLGSSTGGARVLAIVGKLFWYFYFSLASSFLFLFFGFIIDTVSIVVLNFSISFFRWWCLL